MKLKALSKLSDQLREMGRTARNDIDSLRAEVDKAKEKLDQVERAPVDDDEIERRARLIVEAMINDGRSGNAFIIFARAGRFNENDAWHSINGMKPNEMAALIDPERLVKLIVAEAKAATADFSNRGQVTESERATERSTLAKQIQVLEVREELAIRALAEASIIVERRSNAPKLSHLGDSELEVQVA